MTAVVRVVGAPESSSPQQPVTLSASATVDRDAPGRKALGLRQRRAPAQTARYWPPDHCRCHTGEPRTGAYSATMTTPAQLVQEFVDNFVAAWPRGDASSVGALFADTARYHNGPLEPVHGRAAIEGALAEFMAMGGEVAVDMLNLLADDRMVMTERVDHFVLGGKTFSLPVMGIFEIGDGKITAWRDYFDLSQFSSLFDATT